jgi:DNA mismatch repair protein MutL
MENSIRLLPDAIANQIAAGEVVQRPASVVKELLENAVDAGASQIVLTIKEGGKTIIQVVDNGKGMSEVDARMCFERHATSKIALFDDMQKLRTFGFRGEALASIAAVAQVEMKTRQEHQETGTHIIMEGSVLKSLEPIATEKGTSFTIKNLFFNVPARRNFLKSNQVEQAHLTEEFNRVALAYPNVGFSYYHAQSLMVKTAPSSLAKRIVALFGDHLRENIISVSEEVDFLKVSGFIGKPEISKKTRGEQYFFANQRFIKNAYLHHAVVTAFEGLLPQANFPFYALFLELDPARIDINVHPTKTEIKFDNERFVYSVIQAAVRKALQANVMVPVLDFEPPSPWLANFPNSIPATEKRFSNPNSGFSGTSGFSPKYPAPNRNPAAGWEKLYSQSPNTERLVQQFEQKEISQSTENQKFSPTVEKNSPLNLHGKFLVAQVKSGLMLIHMQRAWERILYERFLLQLETHSGASQQLLFPKKIEFSVQHFALIQELEKDIRALGIDFEPFGGRTIVIRGLPTEVNPEEAEGLIHGFLEQFSWNNQNLKLPRKESLARALAKKNSGRQTFHFWKDQELNDLINQLFACKIPNLSPDNLSVTKVVSLSDLESFLDS